MRKRCGNVIFFIQVSLDELDGIQQELEAALSAVVVRQELCRSTMTSSTFFSSSFQVRKRELRQESDVVQNIEKYRGRKQKVFLLIGCSWILF